MSRSPPSSSTPATSSTVTQAQAQVASPMPAPRSPPHPPQSQQPQPQLSPQQHPPAQHQPHAAPTHSNSQLAKLLSDSYREIDVLRRELHDAARRAERAEKILAAVSPSLSLSPNANANANDPNPNAGSTLPDATVRTIMDFEKRATDAEEARDKAEAGKRAIADHWAGFLARRLDREREDREDTGAMARVVEQGGGVLVPIAALGYNTSFSVLGAREGTAFPTLNTPLHYGREREMPPPALARYGSTSTSAGTPRGRDPRPHTAATWPIPAHSNHGSFALSPQTQNLAGRGERVDRGERESVAGMRRPRAGSMDESGAYLGPPPKRARNDRGFDSYPSRDRLPPQPTQPTHPAPGQGHVRNHSYTQPPPLPPQYAQSHHIAHGHRARSFSRSVSPNDREREREIDMRDARDGRGGRDRERERDRRDDRDRERERGSPHSDDIEGLLLDAATDRSPAHHHQSQSSHHPSSRHQQHQQQQQSQSQNQAQHHHQQGQSQAQHHQGIIISAPPAGASASAAASSVGPLAQPGLVTTYQTHIFAPPVTGAPTKKASLPLPGAHAHAGHLAQHGSMPLSSANAGNSPGQPAAAVGAGAGAALGGGGFPPQNAAGQRICRQCGLPGRYKDGKCVEKWGPGPEGPGTVCDRCRKKMKRVERRGTLESQSQSSIRAAHPPQEPQRPHPQDKLHRTDTLPAHAAARGGAFGPGGTQLLSPAPTYRDDRRDRESRDMPTIATLDDEKDVKPHPRRPGSSSSSSHGNGNGNGSAHGNGNGHAAHPAPRRSPLAPVKPTTPVGVPMDVDDADADGDAEPDVEDADADADEVEVDAAIGDAVDADADEVVPRVVVGAEDADGEGEDGDGEVDDADLELLEAVDAAEANSSEGRRSEDGAA